MVVSALLLICACSTDGVSTPRHQPPPLGKSDAEQLLLRADQLKSLALAAGTVSLADAFRGRALQRLEAEVQSTRSRGLHVEERNATRALVFWDPIAGEGVLQVVAE